MPLRTIAAVLLLAAFSILTGCLDDTAITGTMLLARGNSVEQPDTLAGSEPLVFSADPPSDDSTEWIVSFDLPESVGLVESTARSWQGYCVERGISGLFRVYRFPNSIEAGQAVGMLRLLPWVRSIQPNAKAYVHGTFDSKALDASLWNLERMGVPAAWAITAGRPEVVVAVIDTGFKLDHPCLQSAWTADRKDFIDGDNDPSIQNPAPFLASHGTHVAGIIAARDMRPGESVVGIAPSIRIMPIRAMPDNGEGSMSTVANAIYWAADHGANVINMSLGSVSDVDVVKDAIDYAVEKGVTIFSSAGNGGNSRDPRVTFPARYEKVISVGAVDAADQRAVFSSYGPELDVVAPGTKVWTSAEQMGILGPVITPEGAAGYGFMSGTSAACPHAAGVAALYISAMVDSGNADSPASVGPVQVRAWIQGTTVDLGWKGLDQKYGYGRVDAFKATALPLIKIGLRQSGDPPPGDNWVFPRPSGRFVIQNAPSGVWALYGWIDVNRDGLVNAPDYYGEYPAVLSIPGRVRDIILTAGAVH